MLMLLEIKLILILIFILIWYNMMKLEQAFQSEEKLKVANYNCWLKSYFIKNKKTHKFKKI